jgi:hypothetical protein
MAKKSRKSAKPNEGLSGSIGLGADDDVIDTAFHENASTIRPESEGGAADFTADTDRQPLPGGGVRRGEAVQLSEEEDDFEDGRSSSGITSRSQEDQIARGDVGSRAVEVRSGYLSVEAPEDTDVAEAARAEGEPEPSEDIEGSGHEQQGVVAGGGETSRQAAPAGFEKSPGIPVPDERVVEIARTGRARAAGKRGGGRRGGGPSRRSGAKTRKGSRKTGRKTYSQNA